MKQAEKILEKYLSNNYFALKEQDLKPLILKAMKEYAKAKVNKLSKADVIKSLPKPKVICLDCGCKLPSNWITPYCYGCR